MHSFDRFSFGARQLLTVFTVLASAIVIQAQAAVAPVILPATNAPQSAWAKFEKVFILYVYLLVVSNHGPPRIHLMASPNLHPAATPGPI